MQFDPTLSYDVIVAIVGIFVAVWRLNRDIDSKIADLRTELKQDISDLRTELKQDISDLRTELKQDISDLRTELKQDISDLRTDSKADNTDLRTELKAVDAKIDASNQRLARLEGAILSRESLVDAIVETSPTD